MHRRIIQAPLLSLLFINPLAAQTEGEPTRVNSETFDLPRSLMDKKISRQCKRKKAFEAIAG
jgi:hypothetical protein